MPMRCAAAQAGGAPGRPAALNETSAGMATLSESFEKFCATLKASPPEWVRAEFEGATAELAQLKADAEGGGGDGAQITVELDLRGNCLPERFNARLTSADCLPVAEVRGKHSLCS